MWIHPLQQCDSPMYKFANASILSGKDLEMMILEDAIIIMNQVLGPKSIIKGKDRLIEPLYVGKGPTKSMLSW